VSSAHDRPDLSDDQLRELLGLIQGADSVELKLTVPDEDRRSTVVALDLDPLDAYIRQVFFFDTPRSGAEPEGRRRARPPDAGRP
jgi:hypothetical protein